jgi:hypothetical protein
MKLVLLASFEHVLSMRHVLCSISMHMSSSHLIYAFLCVQSRRECEIGYLYYHLYTMSTCRCLDKHFGDMVTCCHAHANIRLSFGFQLDRFDHCQ